MTIIGPQGRSFYGNSLLAMTLCVFVIGQFYTFEPRIFRFFMFALLVKTDHLDNCSNA